MKIRFWSTKNRKAEHERINSDLARREERLKYLRQRLEILEAEVGIHKVRDLRRR